MTPISRTHSISTHIASRKVCLEGIWFRSRLYFSKSLNPLVGEVVQVAFADSASDYLVVIRGENRIRVKLSTYRITGTSLSLIFARI